MDKEFRVDTSSKKINKLPINTRKEAQHKRLPIDHLGNANKMIIKHEFISTKMTVI